MSPASRSADDARHDLYEVMKRDLPFEAKAQRALSIGERYLDVDNGHLTKIDPESDYWKSVASTDPPDGEFPPGLVLNLRTTYCRRTIEQTDSVALHDAPEQGWADDPAFETHGLHCYHGTTISLGEETYGTVCFVSEDPRREPFSDEETMFAQLVARMLGQELQRQRLTDKLERMEQFASVLSHDLRNPLTVALGRVDYERKSRDSEHLETASQSLERMNDLISDVLTMARQGRDIEETRQVSLDSLARTSWQSVDTADAELVVDRDLAFRADADRVRRLLENLFRNAVEHGREDVTVRVGPLDGEEGFYVADDGPGIPEAERETVFETGHSTGADGMGLGLSIVDGVVTAHEWSVDVVESADGGARFEISDVVVPDPSDG